MKKLTIALLFVCANAIAADEPTFKVGATIFADYTNQAATNITSFNVSRGYINITGSLNKWISFRVTPDVPGTQQLRLKYAFGQVNLDEWLTKGSWVRAGVQQTPYIDDQESFYRYRFQGQVFVEREGYLVSSDAGVSAHYNMSNGRADFHAGIYNGEGYSKPEVNGEKALQLRGSVRVMKGVRITGFVDADHYDAHNERNRAIVQATFDHARVRGGVEILSARDRGVNGNGWSAWATPKIAGSWELLLRRDDTRPDGATSQHRTRNIAGVAYWVPGLQKSTAAILVDYDSLTQRNYAPARPRDTRYGLKMLVSF
jgi:hypothetical protein